MSTTLRFRRGLAGLGLVLVASLYAGELVAPHVDPHGDLGCSPAAIVHDSSAHRIRPAGTAPDARQEHCYICHWARAFHSVPPAGERVRGDTTGAEHLYATRVLPHGGTGLSPLPARAPPA